MRITVLPNLSIRVTLPLRMSEAVAERFVKEKEGWIIRALSNMEKKKRLTPTHELPNLDKKGIVVAKQEARMLLEKRLGFFNQHYGFSWNKVTVKDIASRWGSCSKAGNLNFSYKIAFLPPKLADYIVVHELCHLKELNHGEGFWNLVKETIPDYLLLRKELRGVR